MSSRPLLSACWREKLRAVDPKPLDLETITQEVRDAALQVHAAQERLEDRDFIVGVQTTVAAMNARFKELLAILPAAEQALGSLLPRVPLGTAASTPDRQVSGASAVGERRITGVSWTHDRAAPTSGLHVGGEIDAWCGKCGDSKTHSIVAMVGTEPKQVLCKACGSRHAYRAEAARKRVSKDLPEAVAIGRSVVPDREAAKKAEMMRALAEEVATASTVRVFNPKERYKAGEIISHAEYGRGKVENVLRASLLVRFARSGLKPLSLI